MSKYQTKKNIYKQGLQSKNYGEKISVLKKQYFRDNEKSTFQYKNKIINRSQQNSKYRMDLLQQIDKVQQTKKKQLDPFQNEENDRKIVMVKSQKQMRNKICIKQTVDIQKYIQQKQSILHIFPQNKSNLKGKIKILEDLIIKLNIRNKQFILKANEQKKKYLQENEKNRNKIIRLQKQRQKMWHKNLNNHIGQIDFKQNEEYKIKIKNYIVLTKKLQNALQQQKIKNKQLLKDNKNLKKGIEIQRNTLNRCKSAQYNDIEAFKNMSNEQKKFNIFYQLKVKQLRDQLNKKIQENSAIKILNQELEKQLKLQQTSIEQLKKQICKKMVQFKKIMQLIEIEGYDFQHTYIKFLKEQSRRQYQIMQKSKQKEIAILNKQNQLLQYRNNILENNFLKLKRNSCFKCKSLIQKFLLFIKDNVE